MNKMIIKRYKLLKNKKTGKIHCPRCIGKFKTIKIPNSKEECYFCEECKLYFAKEKQRGSRKMTELFFLAIPGALLVVLIAFLILDRDIKRRIKKQ